MGREKVGYLLTSTNLLWMWQSAQPVLDEFLPFLDISEDGFQLKPAASLLIRQNEIADSNSSILISVSEIIAMYVGVATVVSLYYLFWLCTEGRAKFWQNVAFILLASLASAGYGLHAVCVIAQLHISRDNPLYTLLNFMHERWSHNMFQFGMFGLFLLVVWSEKPRRMKTVTKRFHSVSSALSWFPCNCSAVLYSMGGIAIGLFMSIFSNHTDTWYIALTFYISIYASIYLFMKLLKYGERELFLLFCEYHMLGFYVTVATSGLPALFIHAWFFK